MFRVIKAIVRGKKTIDNWQMNEAIENFSAKLLNVYSAFLLRATLNEWRRFEERFFGYSSENTLLSLNRETFESLAAALLSKPNTKTSSACGKAIKGWIFFSTLKASKALAFTGTIRRTSD